MPAFGRYTDSFKPKEKVKAWNEAEKLFEEKKYNESLKAFFIYTGDESVGNIIVNNDSFELYQGSSIVNGKITNSAITADSKIADYDKLGVAVMRRLIEMNYTLFYTRFCLKDNSIFIRFTSSLSDSPPRKLYYALRELAIRADKQDDLLTDEFSTLKPVSNSPVEQLPPVQRETKYKYFTQWINDTLAKISGFKTDQESGAISYLLLDLLYKIDYLITPEGTLMNRLEKIGTIYFAKDNKSTEDKNNTMIEEFKKLQAEQKEKITEDFYKAKFTFGIANPASHQAMIDTYNSNINNVQWYLDKEKDDIAVLIVEYIAGYCLYNYGLAKPTRELFDLLFNILNQQYYIDMGFKDIYYDEKEKKFNSDLVKDRITQIIEEGKKQSPNLGFAPDKLKFETLLSFSRSFMEEIKNLNYNT